MTDEEMAEEYAEEHKEVDWEGFDINKEELKQGFLAGLKAGRPQWHDLRKDPNDLPKETNDKMRVNETWAYVKFFDNTYGIVDKKALKNYSGAIAWCELPTFDKE